MLSIRENFSDSPRESPFGDTQRAQKEGLEFGEYEYDIIDSYCNEKGIEWFASAWDIESQRFLRKYDLYNKIASATLTHVQLLNEVAAERKLTFISTGMADYTDISRAVEIFTNTIVRLCLCTVFRPIRHRKKILICV